ncbi:transposase, partial [Pontiellaceae bacterium B12219]|nr:transposase [Pontiellaceae bacterium B12219]
MILRTRLRSWLCRIDDINQHRLQARKKPLPVAIKKPTQTLHHFHVPCGNIGSAGYAGYTSWLNKKSHATEKATIIHAACWAHARRKFTEVPGNPTAEDIVKLVAKLYRVESKLRNHPELDRAA